MFEISQTDMITPNVQQLIDRSFGVTGSLNPAWTHQKKNNIKTIIVRKRKYGRKWQEVYLIVKGTDAN